MADSKVVGRKSEFLWDELQDDAHNQSEQHGKMDETPAVSVILPSLNIGSYIEECLQSVVGQTLDNIEIICVDAGSTDGTLEIIKSFAESDQRIKVVNSPKKSYGYQMNMGFDMAKGKYLAVVETDDYILPNMLENLYKLAQSNDLDFVKSDHKTFKGESGKREFVTHRIHNDDKYYNRVFNPSDEMPDFFSGYSLCYTWDGIYKRDFIEKARIRHNETPGASYQDTGFRFQIWPHAGRVMLVHEPYYMLRRDNPDSSEMSSGKVFCVCDEYDFIENLYRKNPWVFDKWWPAYVLRRWKSSIWNLGRVAPESKSLFMVRFSSDFKRLSDSDELDELYFDDSQKKQLQRVVDDPFGFYADMVLEVERSEHQRAIDAKEKELKEALWQADNSKKKAEKADKQAAVAKKKLDSIKASKSYRIGRAITKLPRSIRRK